MARTRSRSSTGAGRTRPHRPHRESESPYPGRNQMTEQEYDDPHRLASAGVVVGVDGSPGSDIAVRWAAEFAQRRGRDLQIVHGLDLVGAAGMAGPPPNAARISSPSTSGATGAQANSPVTTPRPCSTTSKPSRNPSSPNASRAGRRNTPT
ncbi:universal stress protein [Nocardia sp. CDC160]|uniref:universal stress protein n=1 Tax=Nocardia sp. CDC160 TaxID=3112166 RepID=UPI003FA3B7C5